jgi:hypothetical protein
MSLTNIIAGLALAAVGATGGVVYSNNTAQNRAVKQANGIDQYMTERKCVDIGPPSPDHPAAEFFKKAYQCPSGSLVVIPK